MFSLALIALLLTLAQAQNYYILQSSFAGGPTFLDNFDFWTSWDPTFGFVHYVDQAAAEQFHMINTTNSSISFGVETNQILDPNANLGRLSLRLTSIESWTHGLFILDLAHMPDATCGTWPSFWSLGGTGTWPMSGEIDIIEIVNDGSNNLNSLHTLPGCTIAGADETGTLLSSDCGLGGGIVGCTVESTSPANSGASFNDNGGGIYAMEWTSVAIRIWFFPRHAIPESIISGSPDVNAFGLPVANFQGSCDIDHYFYNHSLVFNIDFCGQWAGPTFDTDGCPDLDPTNSWSSCNEYVALNPSAFYETYWEVNYLDVYQLVSGSPPPSSTSLSSVTPAVQTSPSASIALSNAQGRSSTPTISIAATTPVITTGSFTATSSVLSVLSSLSTSSVAASAASASSSSETTSWAFSGSSLTVSAVTSLTVVPTTVSVLSAVDSSSPSSSTWAEWSGSSAVPCTGSVCTTFTTAVIVQTVTAITANVEDSGADRAKLNARQTAQNAIEITTTKGLSTAVIGAEAEPTMSSSSINEFGRCDFTSEVGNLTTDFWCTFTSYYFIEKERWTASYTYSTGLLADDPLIISTTLEIDRFIIETQVASGRTADGDSLSGLGASLRPPLRMPPQQSPRDPLAAVPQQHRLWVTFDNHCTRVSHQHSGNIAEIWGGDAVDIT